MVSATPRVRARGSAGTPLGALLASACGILALRSMVTAFVPISTPVAPLQGSIGIRNLRQNSFRGLASSETLLSSIPRGAAAGAEELSPQEELKRQAGYKSVDDWVKSSTVVGLGTGSTAKYAVERLGQKLASGELKDILAIPTSVRTKEQAESLGIPLTTLDEHSELDVVIDGADNIDPAFNMVKGGGGALFREKITELAAKKFIVIVDESKLVDHLGPGFPVPVEITPFAHEHTMRQIAALPSLAGSTPVLRRGSVSNNKVDGDEIAVTDNGNYVVDLVFNGPLEDPVAAANELKSLVGVLEHGIFIGMTHAVIVAGEDGVGVMMPPPLSKL